MSSGASTPVCPVCTTVSSTPVKWWQADKDYTLYQCARCDLQFWWPLETPDPSYYAAAEAYSTHLPQFEVPNWKAIRRALQGLSGKALDVGCGSGLLMRYLQGELGFEAHGVDFDQAAISVARRDGLQNLHLSAFDQFAATCPPGTFDVVTCFVVLEHQNQPNVFLQQIKRVLKPGGWMVGMVPSRSRRQWGENQYLRPPYHFTEWSERSLTEYFRRAGFHPVEIQLDDYGYLVPRALGPLAHRTKTALMSSAGNPEGNPGHAASYHQVLTRMRSLKRLRDIAIAPAVLAEASIERTFGWAAHLLFKAQNRVPLT